jgi:hypothetical protein
MNKPNADSVTIQVEWKAAIRAKAARWDAKIAELDAAKVMASRAFDKATVGLDLSAPGPERRLP